MNLSDNLIPYIWKTGFCPKENVLESNKESVFKKKKFLQAYNKENILSNKFS